MRNPFLRNPKRRGKVVESNDPLVSSTESKLFTRSSGGISQKDVAELLNGTAVNFNAALRTSIIFGPVNWASDQVAGIPLNIYNKDDDLYDEPVNSTDAEFMLSLVDQNLLYDVHTSFMLDGNAFIEKVRADDFQPIQLKYINPLLVKIAADEQGEITGYTVRADKSINPNIGEREVTPENMIHLRKGTDPSNSLRGISPLKALIQEILTDVEAAEIAGTVLRQRSIIGMTFVPNQRHTKMSEELRKAIQENIQDSYSGTNRGKFFYSLEPGTFTTVQADLDKFSLPGLRGISTERVALVTKIPAGVVGFKIGIDQTKVGATLRELRGIAWENAILPATDTILNKLTEELSPEFGNNLKYWYKLPDGHVALDNAFLLAERNAKVAESARADYLSGGITLNEYREALGKEPVPDGDQFKVSETSTTTTTTTTQ